MTVVPREVRAVAAVPSAVSPRAVIVALAFAIVGACALTTLVAFFVFHAHHGFARTVARIVPVPAAVVDGRVVWYAQVVERANALEMIAGVPHDEAVGRAQYLAVRQAVRMRLAERLGVVRDGDEQESFAFAQRIEEAALDDAELQATARGRLERIQLKYEQGIGFSDLAGEYGEGAAVLYAGDLGYVDTSMLPEDLRTTAETLATGEVSDIVETKYAFWLVKAEDVREIEDPSTPLGAGGTRSVWLRVIEVKKDLLGDVVTEQMKGAQIRTFLRPSSL